MSVAARLLAAAIVVLWLALGVTVAGGWDARCTARWDRCQ